MGSDPGAPERHAPTLHGKVFDTPDTASATAAANAAFDYRGDVTVRFRDPARPALAGYVCNRDAAGGWLEVLAPDGAPPQRVAFADVASIALSGEDTAFGKSWDDWQTKSGKVRAAEEERQRVEAAAQGIL